MLLPRAVAEPGVRSRGAFEPVRRGPAVVPDSPAQGRDFIEQAGGLTPDVFLDRAQVTRTGPNRVRSQRDVQLGRAMEGDSTQNLQLESLDEEYVRTARAKGAGEFRVLRRHVLRNAMLPVVTMIGMDIGTALGGVIFIETVFGLPGLGGMLRSAIPGRDLPVILGVVTFTTIGILMLNLIVDLAYAFIDPRVGQAQASTGRRPSARRSRALKPEPAAATATVTST